MVAGAVGAKERVEGPQGNPAGVQLAIRHTDEATYITPDEAKTTDTQSLTLDIG